MRILDERVERYLHELQPTRSEVMAEMEAVAERDGVPIVHWETGRFLAVLCRTLDPALADDAETEWRGHSLAAARALNVGLLDSDRWLACVLPVGDGIAFAARR